MDRLGFFTATFPYRTIGESRYVDPDAARRQNVADDQPMIIHPRFDHEDLGCLKNYR